MCTALSPNIRIYGVPTEAGTHFAGQSKAPTSLLQSARLDKKLQNLGYNVSSNANILSQDITAEALWQPSPKTNGVRNEPAALKVMQNISSHLSSANIDISNDFTFVIGGDCSISPAVISVLTHQCEASNQRLGILYFDGDADLTLPSQTSAEGSSGILDSMVLSTLTQREGSLASMKAFAKKDATPLVNNQNIVLFGFDPLQPSTEHWIYLLENQFKAFTRPTVQKNAVGSAESALAWLKERVDKIFLHFDIDAIDSGLFPLANYPHYAGLGFEEAMGALKVFVEDEKVVGMVVTEVNPNNDPSEQMVEMLVDGIVDGFERRKAKLS